MDYEIFSAREWILMQRKVVVKKSKIQGLGTFAKRHTPKAQVVGYYKGKVFEGGDDTFVHCWCDGKGNEIDILVDGPLRYMNHSSEPNCEISREDTDSEGRHRSVIVSICDIIKGEELTRYYSDYFEKLVKKS